LSEKELALCKRVGPILKEKGLLFVGLDVIGGYITEMNVTSPTGIQELDRLQNLNIADDFMAALERKLLSED
jgi:glutathione synthase